MAGCKPWLWKPGQSGNPKGRPKNSRAAIDVLGRARCEKLLRQEYLLALTGDADARRNILNRVFPVLSRQEISGRDGKPVEIEQAERIAARLDTDTLKDLDALAERIQASHENGGGTNGSGGSVTH